MDFYLNDDARELYGSQVKKYRKAFGCSQQDLGELTGLGVTYINLLENESISAGLDNMAKIASVFGVKFYEFVNPNIPLPAPSKLPASTKKMLRGKTKIQEERTFQRDKLKSAGEKIYKTGTAKMLHQLVGQGFFNTPRTAKEAFHKLNAIPPKKKLTADQQKELGKITVTLGQGRFLKLLDKLEPDPGSQAVRFVEKTPGVVPFPQGGDAAGDLAAEHDS